MKNETYDESESEVIELVGDRGDILKFTHIGTIDFKGDKFVFFQPTDEDSDEVAVFKIGRSGGEEVLLPVEDDELLDEVFNEFVKIYDEEE